MAEFVRDCGKYEVEQAGEVAKGKQTLAELGEEEESLVRLRRWYRAIRGRDVFGAADQVYHARERGCRT